MEVRDVRQDALLVNEKGVNRKKKNAYFLKGCGILSLCLGFHPIHEGPPSLEFII